MNLIGDWCYERLCGPRAGTVSGTAQLRRAEHIGADAPLLAVRGLRIASRIGGRRHTIVSGLDLAVAPGETVGIVGESGSGKSMTARALIGSAPGGSSRDGAVSYEGRNLARASGARSWRASWREIGLIFQDPFTMLNPLLRCGRISTRCFAQTEDGG